MRLRFHKLDKDTFEVRCAGRFLGTVQDGPLGWTSCTPEGRRLRVPSPSRRIAGERLRSTVAFEPFFEGAAA